MMRRVGAGGFLSLLTFAAAACGSTDAGEATAAPDEKPAPVVAHEDAAHEKTQTALREARVLEKSGKLDLAAERYREALVESGTPAGDRADLHLRIARIEFEQNRVENAIEHARHALKLRPDWREAEDFLARVEKKALAFAADKKVDKIKADLRGKKEKDKDGDKQRPRAAGDDADVLRGKLVELRGSVERAEADRAAMKERIVQLETELGALRAQVKKLEASLAERSGR